MANLHISGTLPPGATIRIGLPADEPSQALAALQRHFSGRPAVRKACIGLIQVMTNEPGNGFMYTVGITCERAEDQKAEELAAVEVLKKVPTGRWPISIFPPSKNYFAPDARVFYQRAPAPQRMSFLRKLFGARSRGSLYFVGILYHEPAAWALYQKGIVEDFESSTGIFIEAPSREEAIAWAEKVAEALLRKSNSDDSLNWKALGYHCWIEEDPSASRWKHCLPYFQRIKIGEWPNLDKMGVTAYAKWAEVNGLRYA